MVDVGGIARTVLSRTPFRSRHNGHDSRLPFSSRAPSVQPILPVADMVEAVEFWRRLGFVVTAYDDGYAWVSHCGWELLHLRRVDDLDPVVNEASAYIHVDDAPRWRTAMATDEVIDIVGDVRDEPWGMREFSVVDPAGNHVRFGQHR